MAAVLHCKANPKQSHSFEELHRGTGEFMFVSTICARIQWKLKVYWRKILKEQMSLRASGSRDKSNSNSIQTETALIISRNVIEPYSPGCPSPELSRSQHIFK